MELTSNKTATNETKRDFKLDKNVNKLKPNLIQIDNDDKIRKNLSTIYKNLNKYDPIMKIYFSTTYINSTLMETFNRVKAD
jgi:dihydroorotase